MPKRTATKFIAIHCAATRPTSDIGVEEIATWHRNQGWADVGYNFVIRRDGTVEEGRDSESNVSAFEETGAHVRDYNSQALGICMVGGINAKGQPENNFTPEQFKSLAILVAHCKRKYPAAVVQGHRDFPLVNKACPCFDVKAWWQNVLAKGEPTDGLVVKPRKGKTAAAPDVAALTLQPVAKPQSPGPGSPSVVV
jgi:N-acetyl-anhydromuramyl-L-alanine amidase AmpD